MMFLAFHPAPPSVVCIEEIDRGIHPRMLREVRDLLYRLSYPGDFNENRPPVQVIATTHSPYLLDLFKNHPEEIIISQKHGTSAHFERLADRDDLADLLSEGSLGDIWFSGILGGVPEE
jgi:AAA15 family ATPase/GTPase